MQAVLARLKLIEVFMPQREIMEFIITQAIQMLVDNDIDIKQSCGLFESQRRRRGDPFEKRRQCR